MFDDEDGDMDQRENGLVLCSVSRDTGSIVGKIRRDEGGSLFGVLKGFGCGRDIKLLGQ